MTHVLQLRGRPTAMWTSSPIHTAADWEKSLLFHLLVVN